MKNLKKIPVLLILLFLALTANTQEIEHEAPSLQVGLDGLNFTKGSLDPEIIARIIAEKQNEIKIRLIQNSFLKKLYGSGGTIYNYADNIIKGVLEEPDTDIRTRKIMESTVNLVFVYAFADFYLKQVNNEGYKKELANLKKLAENYKQYYLKDFSGGLKYKSLIELNPDFKSENVNDYNLKNQNFKGNSTNQNIPDNKDNLNQFMSLLIDISSEVIRHNEKLRNLGLMRISYSNNYDYLNLYNIQKNFGNYKNRDKTIYNDENKTLSDSIYKNMSGFLDKYTSSIGAIKFVLDKSNFKSNNVSKKYLENIKNYSLDQGSAFYSNYKNIPLDKKISFISYQKTVSKIDSVIKILSERLVKANESKTIIRENYLSDLETAINKLNSVLNYLKKMTFYLNDVNLDLEDKVLMISDMLYSLKKEIIPNIEYSIKYAPDLIKSKDFIEEYSQGLYTFFLENPKFEFLNTLNKDSEPFVNLVSKLYEFDKTKTFSEYINIISLLDEVFETGKFKTALATINTFVKDYTEISKDTEGNEVLIFNVESFLVKLDNMQSDKINRFQFHFTVGMNTTSFVNGGIDLGNGEQISNFSHFSEKIGLKIKLINRGDWLPKNPGETYGSFGKFYTKTGPPKEPLISNWHILIYGSGILYNVINSGTNKEFNYPMAGIGTGVTFFNALDFNVSVGIPLLEKGGFTAMKNNAFVSFGFDIQIAEYLKELGKKRRERKRNEQLTTAK